MKGGKTNICEGDVFEGTGTHRILVRVVRVEGASVLCTLLRSGKVKSISLKTLHESYTFLRHEAPQS